MRLTTAAISLLMTVATTAASASTLTFRATKKGSEWVCASASKPDNTPGLIVQVRIDGGPTDSSKVLLTATFDNAGTPASEILAFAIATKLWTATVTAAKPPANSTVKVGGTIDGTSIACSETLPAAAAGTGVTETPVLVARYGALDLKALDWLAASGATATSALMSRLASEYPTLNGDNVVILKHLPSGAPAFPFPSSVSERQLIQIVGVVNRRSVGSVEVLLTKCEQPQRERIKGDFGALAATPQGVEVEPDFALLPIGPLIACGPDAMAYTVTSTPDAATAKPEPAGARLEVRPVYHLSATAFLGFDRVKEPTFSGKSGTVAQTEDSFGPGLLVGASWHIGGVDYGAMRWWNYAVNPFVAVSVAEPKDHFVVGTALTLTGGIALAIGGSFHHIDTPDGLTVGSPFSGDGAVPVRKSWTSKRGRGIYIGVAVDTKIFSELKKVGGGAKPGK